MGWHGVLQQHKSGCLRPIPAFVYRNHRDVVVSAFSLSGRSEAETPLFARLVRGPKDTSSKVEFEYSAENSAAGNDHRKVHEKRMLAS